MEVTKEVKDVLLTLSKKKRIYLEGNILKFLKQKRGILNSKNILIFVKKKTLLLVKND